MTTLGETMRILTPAPNVLAFYDGRVPGVRAFSAAPNWLDDAYELGIASYAIIEGGEAIVYDTHLSLAHARLVRAALSARGVRSMRVVLSHAHVDHVAGNEVFADCEIIAHDRTLAALRRDRAGLAGGTPPVAPLVLPSTTYREAMTLTLGAMTIELRHANIHSPDATILILPDGTMLAGDTLEDSLTYVVEPGDLALHLRELARVAGWGVRRILPNHGDPSIIASSGYGVGLIEATRRYVGRLTAVAAGDGDGPAASVLMRDEIEAGWMTWFAPYEGVHRQNVWRVRG